MSVKLLLDNNVAHLANCFSSKQVVHLSDVKLSKDSPDDEVVAVASTKGYIIVTNNRRDFEKEVPRRVAASRKRDGDCTQVHGLVVLLPSDKEAQVRALTRAGSQLRYEGRSIGWQEVRDLCLKVVIEQTGKTNITKLPRCPHCVFDDEGE